MSANKKFFCFAFAWFLSISALSAQTYPRGAILDDSIYNSLPQRAVQLSRSYAAIPQTYSLKQYAPQPGNQGSYGTCTGWACAYAARTVSESVSHNRLDIMLTSNNVFSPVFVYKGSYSLKNIVPTGHEGAVISDILNFMKNEGAVKRLDFEKTADFPSILLSMFANSRRYPIGGYNTLYVSGRGAAGDNTRTERVKKSISEGKPVIIGMNCPDSFFKPAEVWQPNENPAADYGGHAMCVVGYDDTKYGGAFEVLNSWGANWGNRGYIWIPYRTFNQFANQAYEIIEHLSAYKDGAEYDGFVKIEVRNSDQGMPVIFENGYYRTTGSYSSGTRFRYLLGNNKPAYVYAFAGDSSTTDTTIIFPPPGANISAVMDYSENTVALPGESLWIQLDQKTGTDYLVVLYSKEALDIDAIRSRFSTARGTFPQRVTSAVGSNYIPAHQSSYESGEMRFTAKSGNPKAVFGLLLAIDHR
ncbi:MAG: C39 family peptidase [Treponema sp.]|jgi:C1A family cysteine protease|nr:C39 family peptidase [Treponema sp.]